MYHRPGTDNPCAAPLSAKCIADKALQEAIGRGEVVLNIPSPLGHMMGFSHVKEEEE